MTKDEAMALGCADETGCQDRRMRGFVDLARAVIQLALDDLDNHPSSQTAGEIACLLDNEDYLAFLCLVAQLPLKGIEDQLQKRLDALGIPDVPILTEPQVMTTADLCIATGRSYQTIYHRARTMGLDNKDGGWVVDPEAMIYLIR